jgi:3-oxoacyl-[acyl-carrier-protein] synthase II
LKRRRVAVTGIGVLSAIGNGRDAFWRALESGANGVQRITNFDCSTFPVQIAAQVRPFDASSLNLPPAVPKPVQVGLLSAEEAIADARLARGTFDPARAGIVFSISHAGYSLDQICQVQPFLARHLSGQATEYREDDPAAVALRSSFHKGPSTTAVVAARRYGFRGCTSSAHTACATGNQAIGDAFRMVQRGAQEVMLAGSASASVHPFGIVNFALLNALSTRNDAPEKASRPFDRERNGFVVGEGGAAVVLEELEHARARGARVYAEILGYGVSLDTFGMTQMDPEATGASLCIRRALAEARLEPAEIDYINAHGTSTPLNDKTETLAIKKVFGPKAYQVPISSTKSMIGHLLSGAGAVELVAALLSIERAIVHPTINYEVPDPECDLDYVPNRARTQRVRTVLSNSFGFGGQNSCIVVGHYAG